jgi:dual specificity phosphatase 12
VDSILPAQCAHFFLEPQDWMQSTIDEGELEGKLECPKCFSKVGGYAWQGMRCSCGKWVTPCFSLGKGKVDEVRRLSVPNSNGVMKPGLAVDRHAVDRHTVDRLAVDRLAVDGVKSRV